MTDLIRLYTIGFTKKSAKEFFTALKKAGVSRILDVRLNNRSQLAGFTKKDDLAYFLREIVGIDYVHAAELAPTQDILTAYKQEKGEWSVYETKFLSLIRSRRIEETIPKELVSGSCLLCSEKTPHKCHRRLVAEYLADKWGNVEIEHIG